MAGRKNDMDCGQICHVPKAQHMTSPMVSHKIPEEEVLLQMV